MRYEGNETNSEHGDLFVRGHVGNRPVVFGAHTERSNNQALAEQYPDVFALEDLRDVSGNTVVVSAAQRQPFTSEADSRSVWGRVNIAPDLEVGVSYRQARYANDYSTLSNANEYGGFLDEAFLSVYQDCRKTSSFRSRM